MAVIECSRCGGSLEINADMSVGTCMYCGSVITIPKSWEKKSNLYNRANYLRQSNEFDKAAEIFEDILKEDNTEAEAHWGALMCTYGIEYVKDPTTNERIPTCHRTEHDSIFTNPSYLAAMEYADASTRQVYQDQAQRIDKIQQKILRIAEQEEPYDVFICYKQGDEKGERTPDSYIGEDLYYELTRGGYKVFFAQQSLRPGTDYEPYIFSALYTSKVLVVIGTKEDYVNAVWVRNEWSRFLAMMKKDPDKTIIPIYKDMNPYDFPKELGRFHAMDVTRMGFLQEIRDGINRIVRKPQKLEMPQAAVQPMRAAASNVNVEGLLKRAYIFLEDGDFNSAASYFNKVLDQTPEEGQAYWGQLLVELKCRSNKDVAKKSLDISRYGSYQKALRYSNENLVNEYTAVRKQCMDNIRRDEEEKARQQQLAKEREQRRIQYHNDFDALKRKYSKKEESTDPIFANWQAQKVNVDRARYAYNAANSGKRVSWWTIWISVAIIVLVMFIDYAMRNPQVLNSGVGIVLALVIGIPCALLAGVIAYFILSIFTDPGCISWIIIIVAGFYGGSGAVTLLALGLDKITPVLLAKPWHYLAVAIAALLIVLQIIRGIKGRAQAAIRKARQRELSEQENILNREWNVVREYAFQEVAALNAKNHEFAKELHQGEELFK